ncbi:MAG TPA: serine dehydratase subunit alpha family protein, partial [Acholeplasmataceae bacterium]|nr:serine dehydratase subunit alpha family protein [Acholeplasmataceae bacterium]
MNQEYYLQQLEEELVIALGCTEPVSVAFAAALARKEAGYDDPVESIELQASVNIYKNAMSVFIPGTNDMGAAMAAALGAVGGDPSLDLQVLQSIGEEDIVTARKLCAEGKVSLDLAPRGAPSLYIDVTVRTKDHRGRAVVAWKHDLVMELERDGVQTFLNDTSQVQGLTDSITVDDLRDIWDFATTVDVDKLDLIRQTIGLNDKIAVEGMSGSYGLEVGRSIAKACRGGKDVPDVECCSLSD